jgi:hypothetical protein
MIEKVSSATTVVPFSLFLKASQAGIAMKTICVFEMLTIDDTSAPRVFLRIRI